MSAPQSHLLDIALLGTEKAPLRAELLVPAELGNVMEAAEADASLDVEERLLHVAVAAIAYRRAGAKSFAEPVAVRVAPEEERPYCTTSQYDSLKAVLAAEMSSLLKLWLQLCMEANLLVPPQIIPKLFTAAERDKSLRPLVTACAGARGTWLSTFNKAWAFADTIPEEEVWTDGSASERAIVLERWMKEDPEKGREALQETWPKEDLTSKATLLRALRHIATVADLTWLESLKSEKGKKVKEELGQVLAGIPGSSVNNLYWELARNAVRMEEKSGVLGIGKRRALRIDPPKEISEEVLATGLVRITPGTRTTNFSEPEFSLYQFISFIQPQRWEEHLGLSPAEIITAFKKAEGGELFIPALGLAASRYQIASWAPHFLDNPAQYYSELIPLLSTRDRDAYLIRIIENDPSRGTQVLKDSVAEEWSLPLAEAFFKAAAHSPYANHKGIIAEVLDRIPLEARNCLEGYSSPDEYSDALWKTNKLFIEDGLALKARVLQSFSS